MNGEWKYYRCDGTLFGKGRFLNGNNINHDDVSGIPHNGRTGIWKFYYEDGQKVYLYQTHRDGELDGLFKCYSRLGEVISSGFYKNDKKWNGLFPGSFDSYGDVFSVDYYKNGQIIIDESLKIFLKGYTSNLSNEYKKAKLFVLPSIYEGLGNVLLDALNFSVPCISTKCKSGPKEILCNGKGGTLVPIKNINLLTKALINDIDNYKNSIKKMTFARKRISRFYVFSQSELYINELNKVLK